MTGAQEDGRDEEVQCAAWAEGRGQREKEGGWLRMRMRCARFRRLRCRGSFVKSKLRQRRRLVRSVSVHHHSYAEAHARDALTGQGVGQVSGAGGRDGLVTGRMRRSSRRRERGSRRPSEKKLFPTLIRELELPVPSTPKWT